jgi:hypothetical protein
VLAGAGAAALALTGIGFSASPAAAAPETFFSSVEGNLALKGSPSVFNGVTIAGTYDAETGALTAQAVFPQSTQVRENQPAAGTNAEVVVQVSQPEPATGTVSETGEVALDATFQIILQSVTLIAQETGARTPLPIGEPGTCKFAPIEVDLVGTATSTGDGPVTISVADDEFVIPPPVNPATDCGPAGFLIYPNVAGPAPGEDPNSAALSFVVSSAQAQVEAIYQAVLGRTAANDQASLDYWANRIEGGESPASVALVIARSREGWRNAVIDSYRIALQREPETAGVNYWTNSLLKAQDQPYLIGRMFSSPEAAAAAEEAFPDAPSSNAAFVAHAYQVLFDRAPDAGGLAYWTDRINAASNQAAARNDVAERFYRHPEGVSAAADAASVVVCGVPAQGEQAEILADGFVAGKYNTRVLLAVASVTPCPELIG